jgi:hypothetical protein
MSWELKPVITPGGRSFSNPDQSQQVVTTRHPRR